MQTFYVSLTRDLIGCYLEFRAESELALRQYLAAEYLRNGVWKLPWCSIYSDYPRPHGRDPVIIKAQCGDLYQEPHTTVEWSNFKER